MHTQSKFGVGILDRSMQRCRDKGVGELLSLAESGVILQVNPADVVRG
jgi:hypothetical protein